MTIHGSPTHTIRLNNKSNLIPNHDLCKNNCPQVFDDVPSLCRNGVCTSCAAKVTQGSHDSYLVGFGIARAYWHVISPLSCR